MDIKKYAPIILSVTASIGVIATAVLSHKATEKVMEDPDSEDNWKHYIPTVAVVTGTIGCIVGANVLSYREQVSLANAYVMLFQSFDQYKKKVIEHHGMEEHERILDELRVEKANPPKIVSECFFENANGFYDEHEEPKLFYDEFTNRYFEAKPSDVLQAEYYMNRNYVLGWDVTMKDWCEFLGLEPIKDAEKMYIDIECGLGWIDFNHRKVIMDDGLECWIIDMLMTFDSPQDG